ncbi:MAG: hypothetical protein FJ286_03210 [Planctomycetes bacterium]|nr:hypothetical protein [Planctomycetota bacterium]
MVTFTAMETIGRQSPAGMPAALVSGGDLLMRERARPVVTTGFRSLDALLPAGGVRPGSLVEWLAEGDGGPGAGGAASLAFAVACRLAAAGAGDASEATRPRTILVVDRTGWFHPPAVLPWLDDKRRLVVARVARDDDEIWAIDQALRCTGVAAVLAWPRMRSGARSRVTGSQWSTAMRRWQLAAASSGAVGLFVRPMSTRSESSWAEARIAVSPLPGGGLTERRLRLRLAGGSWSAGVAEDRHVADVMLDLAKGCAGTVRTSAGPPWSGAIPQMMRLQGGDSCAERGGVACRAS